MRTIIKGNWKIHRTQTSVLLENPYLEAVYARKMSDHQFEVLPGWLECFDREADIDTDVVKFLESLGFREVK